MSKARARGPESYKSEARFHQLAAKIVEQAGFRSVKAVKFGPIKTIEATAADGTNVSFWLKLGWSKELYAAVQFGMFKGAGGASKTDSEFQRFVAERVTRMKKRGITHALLVHRNDFALALKIDDVVKAYSEQLKRFPRVARNTKSPTMWIYDPRPRGHGEVAALVWKRAIPLETLATRSSAEPFDPDSRLRIAEVEIRMMQAAFRLRVAERCGWKCAVTGCDLDEVLDSAHLPGREWRKHNEASDGVLLRADIHRLLDSGLARIVKGRFVVSKQAMHQYGAFHRRELCV